jgi:hypothetical protein
MNLFCLLSLDEMDILSLVGVCSRVESLAVGVEAEQQPPDDHHPTKTTQTNVKRSLDSKYCLLIIIAAVAALFRLSGREWAWLSNGGGAWLRKVDHHHVENCREHCGGGEKRSSSAKQGGDESSLEVELESRWIAPTAKIELSYERR